MHWHRHTDVWGLITSSAANEGHLNPGTKLVKSPRVCRRRHQRRSNGPLILLWTRRPPRSPKRIAQLFPVIRACANGQALCCTYARMEKSPDRGSRHVCATAVCGTNSIKHVFARGLIMMMTERKGTVYLFIKRIYKYSGEGNIEDTLCVRYFLSCMKGKYWGRR